MAERVVHFQPLGRKTALRKGFSLLELARDAGVPIESVCASAGKCGKCKVVIASGKDLISLPTDSERKLLGDIALSRGTRLACQAKVEALGRIVVEVPEESVRGHHRLLASGVEPEARLEPAVRKYVLRIPPATLKDLRADDDRLLEVLYKKAKVLAVIAPEIHGHVPRALREKAWETTVTLFRDEELMKAEPGDTSDDLFGVAVDIGTTKVVAYLVDLRTGETKTTQSMPNPQIPYGEDLMSRISFTIKEKDGGERLQKVLMDGLNELIRRLCSSEGIDPEDILEVMVVGNTAMHHIFFGIPAQHVAAAPYAPVVRAPLVIGPERLGLDMYPFGKVSALPNIAGFVGADAVADLISSGLYKDKSLGMMIDIGTNTEIIAGTKDRLISCSCASGPAFEGAHIRFGMRAATGAVERVWIDPETKDVKFRTVDDARPRGICGSGIVDAISEMFRAGLLDHAGKIRPADGCRRVRKGPNGGFEFVLVDGKEAEGETDITIAQKDVEEIQLAKAAIYTGVSILMNRLKTRTSAIKRIYAAGAFGTYVDASAAITIGMYPDIPLERIKFIGNAAGSGARLALKSVRMRDLADELSRRVEYVELASDKDFQKEFAQAMFLPHRETSRFPSVDVSVRT